MLNDIELFIRRVNKGLLENLSEYCMGTPIAFFGRCLRPVHSRRVLEEHFRVCARDQGWILRALPNTDFRDAVVLVRGKHPELWVDPRLRNYTYLYATFAKCEFDVSLENDFFKHYNAGHLYNAARAANAYEAYVRIHPMQAQINQRLGSIYEIWSTNQDQDKQTYLRCANSIVLAATIGIAPPEREEELPNFLDKVIEIGLVDKELREVEGFNIKKNWDVIFNQKGGIINIEAGRKIELVDFANSGPLRVGKRRYELEINPPANTFPPTTANARFRAAQSKSALGLNDEILIFEEMYIKNAKIIRDNISLYSRSEDSNERKALLLKAKIEEIDHVLFKLILELRKADKYTKDRSREKIKDLSKKLMALKRIWAFRAVELRHLYSPFGSKMRRWVGKRRREEHHLLWVAERSVWFLDNLEVEEKHRTIQLHSNRLMRRNAVKLCNF